MNSCYYVPGHFEKKTKKQFDSLFVIEQKSLLKQFRNCFCLNRDASLNTKFIVLVAVPYIAANSNFDWLLLAKQGNIVRCACCKRHKSDTRM